MNEILLKGSKNLSRIDLDIELPQIKIYPDYIHIHPFYPGEIFHLHAHPNFEFHYIAHGKGTVGFFNDQLNPSEIIRVIGLTRSSKVETGYEYRLNYHQERIIENSQTQLELKAGDVFINKPGQFHWQKSDEHEHMVEYSMRCFIDFPEMPGNKLSEEFELVKKLLYQEARFIVTDNFKVKDVFERIFEEAYYQQPGFISKIQLGIIDLVIDFARNQALDIKYQYAIPEVDIKKHRMRMIANFIESNLSHNITIEVLCKNIYLSERSISRLVKSETGQSVHQFILSRRVARALELIKGTDKKLLEIASMTGFYSDQHLSRIIKSKYGKPPSSFRNG